MPDNRQENDLAALKYSRICIKSVLAPSEARGSLIFLTLELQRRCS